MMELIKLYFLNWFHVETQIAHSIPIHQGKEVTAAYWWYRILAMFFLYKMGIRLSSSVVMIRRDNGCTKRLVSYQVLYEIYAYYWLGGKNDASWKISTETFQGTSESIKGETEEVPLMANLWAGEQEFVSSFLSKISANTTHCLWH